MIPNRGGNIVTKEIIRCESAAERMSLYDNLDPEIRKILREAPFSLTMSTKWRSRTNGVTLSVNEIKHLKSKMIETQKKSTIATYGRNHPDAN
jgi:hypothetical protein